MGFQVYQYSLRDIDTANYVSRICAGPRFRVFTGFDFADCGSLAGTLLAESSLFLVCALSLAVFRITKPVIRGEVVEPSLEFTWDTIR